MRPGLILAALTLVSFAGSLVIGSLLIGAASLVLGIELAIWKLPILFILARLLAVKVSD